MIIENRDPYIDRIGDLHEDPARRLALGVHEYVVVETMEAFKFDDTIFSIFGNVSSAALQGIEVVNSLFVDPLFPSPGRAEPLKIGLRNLNPDAAVINLGAVIGKMAFFDVSDTYPVDLRPGSSQAARFSE